MIGDLYSSAAGMLDAVAAALEDGPTNLPERRSVTVGQVSWLGQCDQLMISLGPTWLTTSFPNPASYDPQGQCMAAMLGCDLTLALVRCFPVTDGSQPVPVQALDSVAQIIGADHQLLANTIPCTLADQVSTMLITDFAVPPLMVIGPDGGRISIEVVYKIELPRG